MIVDTVFFYVKVGWGALCFSLASVLPFSLLVLVGLSLFIFTFLGLGCDGWLFMIRVGGDEC